MKARKFFANLFVGLVNATCLFTFFACNVEGLVIGGIGVLGVIGQILLNVKDKQ
jgi:hypothetical protein